MRPKDLLGRCFFDFEARPSHISNRRFLSALRKHGEVKNYVTHLISTDGSDRWVGINARVSHDDERRRSSASAAPRATSPSSTRRRCRSSISPRTTR